MATALWIVLYFILFCAGVMLVVWGSNGVVMGATLINKLTKVPMFFLGMFMVALATTSPEFTVNVFATIDGNVQIAIGNIIGSNIFNIAVILGLCASIRGIHTSREIVVGQVPLAVASIMILGALCFDGELTRIDGIILMGFFAAYLIYLYICAIKATKQAKKLANAQQEEKEEEEGDEPRFLNIFWEILFAIIDWFRSLVGKEKHAQRKVHEATGDTIHPVAKLLIFLVIGFSILIGGSKIMVYSAVGLATIAGVPEAFIGLTIVALGTSMPELAVSIMAIIKKKKDLALGNIVGANTFNALWALGFDTFFLRSLPFDKGNMIDIYMAFGVAFFLWAFMYIGKRYELERWQGFVFLFGYVIYVGYKYISLTAIK